MAKAANAELVERFEQFFRDYYRPEIGELARKFPTEQRSLYVDWNDLYRFDADLADDYLSQPEQLRDHAEEALRVYDLPVDVKLGGAHVRVHNLPETTEIRAIRSQHVNTLVSVRGLVRKATDVRPKIQEAAFECQRCGTLTRVTQAGGDFQEPHECQGCERQGPYRLNVDQSEFVDSQQIRIQESPEGLRGGETPRSIDVRIEDDLTGEVSPGENVRVTGVLRLDQSGEGDQSPVFDIFMEGVAITVEEEQFEDMEITEEDKKEIIKLSEADDIYDRMIGSIAPSIYGYDQQKLAIALQLFSGVTKHLPDGTRIRGDLHMLLIGDPGTGKCLRGDTKVTLADGTERRIGDLVESNLDDPTPVDDGVYDAVDFEVPTMEADGTMSHGRATKVWKREAPDRMYRIRTERGKEIEVTPSHPLFVASEGEYEAVRADELPEKAEIATCERRVTTDGAGTRAVETASTGGMAVESESIASVVAVDPDYDWVYDLEVEETHNYVSNNVVSHNSQLLQYVQKIAPRSVYTSGKGASTAGLCVTGDTLVHTAEGFRPIAGIAHEDHPDPVSENTPAESAVGLYSYDEASGEIARHESSHVWRMPEKPCRRIETARGKQLEASVNTPVLTCGPGGIEWKQVSEIEPGEYVGVPKYDGIDRSTPPVREFVEFSTEKVKMDDVRIPREFDRDLLYLLGLVFGDGDIRLSPRDGNRGLVRISNGNERVLERAADIVERKFDKTVEIERQDDRVPCIRIHSATVARLFHNVGMRTPKTDLALSPRLTTAENADAFLRGLMDADGSVSRRTDGGSSVQLSTVSETLARQVQAMLETYGVHAKRRERDRRGVTELADGRTVESKHTQYHLEVYGRDVDAYADGVGFGTAEKRAALERIVEDASRRGERIPVGGALASAEASSSTHYSYLGQGSHPGRDRARAILGDVDLGSAEPAVAEAVEADLRWDEVVAAVDTGEKEVYDLTVPETHNFLADGVVTHNTAAAVRDDFGEGQQWTLEAGALVLADQGIAAVDELDKMKCVTGDTLVQAGDRLVRIDELARDAADSGSIEQLSNGRTIRDVDAEAWTMADNGRIVRRPVTAVHEYDAPEALREVALESGESVTATADHPFFVLEDGERVEKPAEDLDRGDWVYVPRSIPPRASDGGTGTVAVDGEATEPDLERPDDFVGDDVTWRRVERVTTVDPDVEGHEKVYDLTVEGTHNFVANGMVVHNSEDRSAMHEALEQQSYHPETEVLLADGRRVEIGEFVDGRMADEPGRVQEGIDCEVLPVDDVRVHSVDLDEGETTKLPVDRVSRHEAPEEFVRIEFSNGRSVLVTPEHPTFVDRDGEIGTVPAEEAREGAFVPAPRKLPNSSAPVELDDEPHQGKEKDVDLPDELTGDLAEALGFLVAEGHNYAGSAHEIGFSNQDRRLLARMDRLMRSVFGVESTDTTNAAGTVTKRWVSTKLYRWFERNVPEVMHTARDKRIPARVLGASEEHVRRFLVGAFAGDGGVESEAMSFSTASEGLANDYADALAKIGVASRIHHSKTEDSWKTYVMGDSTERFVEAVVDPAGDRHDEARAFAERSNETPRHHDVLPTSAAREIREIRKLLGLRLTGEFGPHLDEGFGVQVETVRSRLSALRERVDSVRETLADCETPGEVRAAIDWSGRDLARRLDGETSSSIHYAEGGGYDQERRDRLASRARTAVENAVDEAEERIDALERRCDLRYYRVTGVETVPNEGDHATEWVYDVTVEPTSTFVSQGVVLHNSISISKAGINATLKSRCSLLGAANPKYGRFDQYEPIGEQIDLEPALISRFDLIFTVTDQPDEEKDRKLAEHILTTNYAGEINTQREQMHSPDVSREEVEEITETVDPTIDPDLLRKYVAYAKQNCHPRMTEDARTAIREFYTDLRAKGTDEDAPVPVTARKLEALVRLAEASARIRLADRVTAEDATRVIEIVRSCLEDVGVDPESGDFDADVVETGTSKSQRERIKNVRQLIADVEAEYDEGAPLDVVLERAEEVGMDPSKAEHEIEKLKQKGEVYQPSTDHLRTT